MRFAKPGIAVNEQRIVFARGIFCHAQRRRLRNPVCVPDHKILKFVLQIEICGLHIRQIVNYALAFLQSFLFALLFFLFFFELFF